jgi:hypothetical protein
MDTTQLLITVLAVVGIAMIAVLAVVPTLMEITAAGHQRRPRVHP